MALPQYTRSVFGVNMVADALEVLLFCRPSIPDSNQQSANKALINQDNPTTPPQFRENFSGRSIEVLRIEGEQQGMTGNRLHA